MELSIYLPGPWSQVYIKTAELTTLEPSAKLDIVHDLIINTLYSPLKHINSHCHASNVLSANINTEIDEHVQILANAIVMAAMGDTWKLERYLRVRGLICDESYPQIEKID